MVSETDIQRDSGEQSQDGRHAGEARPRGFRLDLSADGDGEYTTGDIFTDNPGGAEPTAGAGADAPAAGAGEQPARRRRARRHSTEPEASFPTPIVLAEPEGRTRTRKSDLITEQATNLSAALVGIVSTVCDILARTRGDYWALQPVEKDALTQAGTSALKHLPVPKGEASKYLDYAFAGIVVGSVFLPRAITDAIVTNRKRRQATDPFASARSAGNQTPRVQHNPNGHQAGGEAVSGGQNTFGQDNTSPVGVELPGGL